LKTEDPLNSSIDKEFKDFKNKKTRSRFYITLNENEKKDAFCKKKR